MKRFEGFMKGVNLGGWLSQCDYSEERCRSFIRPEDFTRIRSWGADHVRVPVDYDLLEPEAALEQGSQFAELVLPLEAGGCGMRTRGKGRC